MNSTHTFVLTIFEGSIRFVDSCHSFILIHSLWSKIFILIFIYLLVLFDPRLLIDAMKPGLVISFISFLLACVFGGTIPDHTSHARSLSSLLPSVGASGGSACRGNTASTRDQWCDYNIHTDYTTVVPTTNVTREYWFNLERVTVAPDGRSRKAIAINGSIPGPTIEANWGDEVVIHLTNSLPNDLQNGTSIHFHGIRQFWTNQNDGVVSITQCPTAPNNTITYRWRAMQYGTTWYHSHIG